MPNLANLTVTVGANTGPLRRGMDRASTTIKRAGRKLQSAGASLTRNVTVPLAAAGGAAVTFATTFNDKAQEVGSTANLTSQEISGMKETVEDVAIATGESTDRIFDAFQKAVSGSLDFVESQEAVRAATKASAAGFGETQQLVNVATTAFDLFGDEGLETADVLDKIINAAQNTQTQVKKVVGAFSRAAPVAESLGISMDSALSVLTVVSERMGDTARGGRATASMLNLLLKPSKSAQKNIEKLFGSLDKFQNLLADDTIGTLSKLKNRLEENNQTLADVITNKRALNAAQLLLSDSGERASEVLRQQTNAAGAVNRAFKKSATFARLLSRTWQALKAALRPLGDAIIKMLIPAFNSLVPQLIMVGNFFENLSPTTKKWTVRIGALVAGIGPLLFALGSLVTVGGTVIGVMASSAAVFTALLGPIGAVIAAIAAINATLAVTSNNTSAFAKKSKAAWNLIGNIIAKVALGVASAVMNNINKPIAQTINKLIQFANKASGVIPGIGNQFDGLAETTQSWARGTTQAADTASQAYREARNNVRNNLATILTDHKVNKQKVQQVLNSWKNQNNALNQNVNKMRRKFKQNTKNMTKNMKRMGRNVNQTMDRVSKKRRRFTSALASGFNRAFKGLIKGSKDFGDALTAIWDSIVSTIISMISRMIAKAIVAKIITTAITGGAGLATSAAGASVGSGGALTGGAMAAADDGGVVPGQAGEPQIIQAHAGETILPTHKKELGGIEGAIDGGGGQQVTINVSGDEAGEEIFSMLVDEVRTGTGAIV